MGLDTGVRPDEGMSIWMAQEATQPIRVYLVSLAAMLCTLLGALSFSAAAASTCEPWVAKLVSAQGNVQVRRAGETQW